MQANTTSVTKIGNVLLTEAALEKIEEIQDDNNSTIDSFIKGIAKISEHLTLSSEDGKNEDEKLKIFSYVVELAHLSKLVATLKRP